jgi:rod shape-determining protein MreC
MAKRRSLGIISGLGGPWVRGLLVILVLLSIALLAIDRARPEQSPFFHIKQVVADGARPALTILSAPLRTLNQVSAGIASNWQAAKRVRELERDNRNLMQWRDLALALHEKMNRYEELLGAPQAPTPIVITARAITDAGGPFVRARLVNVGTDDGVAEGQAVLAYNGLIGRVMSVGKRTARVLLLTDLNSRVPVFITDIGAHAILAGDNSGAPRLIYIERGVQVDAGMRIITSGEDGVLPRGLAIGEVASARGKDWRVSLFARPERVDFVSILEVPAIQFEEVAPEPAEEGQAPEPAVKEGETTAPIAELAIPPSGGQ